MRFVRLLVPIALVGLMAGCNEMKSPVASSPAGASTAGSAASNAQTDKVAVCHVDTTGAFALITVSAGALPAHQAHGDGLPLGPVPGNPALVFDAACVAVPATKYTVGGTVSGLAGTGLVLRNNGGDDLTIASNGTFTFSTALATGAAYAVTVFAQPAGQTCTVTAGSGTMGSANVTNVSAACVLAGKRVFVSSSLFPANLGGLVGADASCQALADTRGLGGSWKAWLSSSVENAASRLTHASEGYRLIDGTLVASSDVGFFSTSHANPIDLDETGSMVVNAEVWTGSGGSGVGSGGCADFTSSDVNGAFPAQGISSRSDFAWSNIYLQTCDRVARLYCVEQ